MWAIFPNKVAATTLISGNYSYTTASLRKGRARRESTPFDQTELVNLRRTEIRISVNSESNWAPRDCLINGKNSDVTTYVYVENPKNHKAYSSHKGDPMRRANSEE